MIPTNGSPILLITSWPQQSTFSDASLTKHSHYLPATALLLAFHPASAGGATGYRDLQTAAIPQTLVTAHCSIYYATHGLPQPNAPSLPLLHHLFHALLPPVTPPTPTDPPFFHFYHRYSSLLPDLNVFPAPGLTQ